MADHEARSSARERIDAIPANYLRHLGSPFFWIARIDPAPATLGDVRKILRSGELRGKRNIGVATRNAARCLLALLDLATGIDLGEDGLYSLEDFMEDTR